MSNTKDETVELASLQLRLRRSENLPLLPQVASAVLRVTDSPYARPQDIARLIDNDPATSAKLLKIANSSFYGLKNVRSVARAVEALGTTVVRNAIISIAFLQMLGPSNPNSKFSKLEFWRHSLATGFAAKLIALRVCPGKAEELYSAGMLHDIGMLLEERYLGAEFETVIEAAQDRKIPIHEAEGEALGYDHTETGALLADTWMLNKMVRNAIRFHHHPERDPEFFETTCVVTAANAIAHACGFSNNSVGVIPALDHRVSVALGLSDGEYTEIAQMAVEEVVLAHDLFNIR